MELNVSRSVMHEVANLVEGLYLPVSHYMNRDEYRSVVDKVRLKKGETFPLPIALSIPSDRDDLKPGRKVALCVEKNTPFAELEITDRFEVDPKRDIPRIFKTASTEHPGVVQELARGTTRLGGTIRKFRPALVARSESYRRPRDILALKKKMGLRTLVGFQTRNAIHRAHEHLIRTAMELFDAILIQPLVGDRKDGDFSERAIVNSYRAYLDAYLPPKRVVFATWQAAMRYAGPREGLMHALVRRNFGCTHFIVGRDQAGVGSFYGKYEAQEFCLAHPLPGLTIVPFAGPFWCKICNETVSERTCRHLVDRPQDVEEVSGSRIRKLLQDKQAPGPELLRPEVAAALLALGAEATFI